MSDEHGSTSTTLKGSGQHDDIFEQRRDVAQATEIGQRMGWYLRHIRAYWRLFARKFIIKPGRRFVHHYRDDPWFRVTSSLKFSTMINLFFVFYQAWNAYSRSSFWFGALAFYYAMLTTMRVLIVNYMQTDAADGREELRRYRSCGVMLLILTTIVVVMGVVINRVGQRPDYSGLMIYVMAAFTIYNVFIAFVNLIKYRRLEDPVISASKALVLATALVSVYSMQTALIGRFATESDGALVSFLSYFTPTIVFLAIAGIALFIIIRTNWVLKHVG